jgi:hypothetical protein
MRHSLFIATCGATPVASCRWGAGAVYSSSQKQKKNTKSSTEAELVGANDVLPQILGTKYFMEAQGYGADNVLYQDNQSIMKLEQNGKASSGKRTRHINIRYFFITNQIAKKEVAIQYCPTKQMIANYFTNPYRGPLLQVPGSDSRIGPNGDYPWGPKECVGIQSHVYGKSTIQGCLRVSRMTYVNVPRWPRAIQHGSKWPGLV